MSNLSCILTIGGLDPSGGAGLPADARAVAAFGGHACGIATAVIAQNTCGVARIEAVATAMLAAQLDNLLEDITPRSVKIGMIPNAAAVQIIAERLQQMPSTPVIVDTVFAPSTGPIFSGNETIKAITDLLLPGCDFLTPNIPEAARLLGRTLETSTELHSAARELHAHFGAKHILLKGGHGNGEAAADLFYDGENIIELSAPRIHGYEVRGTGCLLASAIAALRAQGVLPEAAARQAKRWLHRKISEAKQIGQGRRVAVGH